MTGEQARIGVFMLLLYQLSYDVRIERRRGSNPQPEVSDAPKLYATDLKTVGPGTGDPEVFAS